MRRALITVIAVLAVLVLTKACAWAQIIMQPLQLFVPVGYQQLPAPLQTGTVTITIATPAVVTLTNHGYVAGTPVVFTNSGGNLPTGITSGQTYFVIAAGLTTSAFEIAATPGGAAIATSGTQAGVQTVTAAAALLTVPSNARMAVICSEAQNVRWRDDGIAPTATVGMILITGGIYGCMTYSGNPLTSMQFVAATAGAILDVSYYR